MIQLEQQQHGEFWVGRVVGNIPTTYIQLTLWLDQKEKERSLVATTSALARVPCVSTHYVRTNIDPATEWAGYR